MGIMFAFMTAFLYAGSNIIMKKGMATSEKDNGAFHTVLINVVILGFVLIIYRLIINNSATLNVKGLLLFIIAGLLTSLFGRAMHFIGIRKIGSAKASVIKNSAPIFTLCFAVLILNEVIEGWPWVGLSLIILGLLFQDVGFFRNIFTGKSQFGVLFALLGAIGFGFGQGVRKQALLYFNDPFAGAFIGSLVAMFGFMIIEMKSKTLIPSIKDVFSLNNKYYLVAGVMTSFAVLFFFIALWFTQVTYVAAIVAIEPVLCVFLSKFFLAKEEVVTKGVLVSSALIFVGAGIISIMA